MPAMISSGRSEAPLTIDLRLIVRVEAGPSSNNLSYTLEGLREMSKAIKIPPQTKPEPQERSTHLT